MDATGLYPVLVEGAARGALLLAGAVVLVAALRRASAAMRHVVWTVALGGLLVLPAIQVAAPRVEVRSPSWLANLAASVSTPVATGDPSVTIDDAHLAGTSEAAVADAANGTAATSSTFAEPSSTVGRPASSVARRETAPWTGARMATVSATTWLVLLWVVVALTLMLPLLAGRFGVRRLESRTRRIADERICTASERLAGRAGLRRPPQLVIGPERMMPMTWGIVRPVVALPPESATWPKARLEAVLLHEFAHVARRDCLTQLVADLARAIHWFNPLVWLAARRLRIERELACDDVALRSGARASDYAEELLALARAYGNPSGGHAAVAMARPHHLKHRLAALLDERRPRARTGARTTLFTALAAVGMVVPVATLAPAQTVPQRPHLPAAPAIQPPAAMQAPVAGELPVSPRVPAAPPVIGVPLFPAAPPVHEAPLALPAPRGLMLPNEWTLPPAGRALQAAQGVTCAEARTGWRSMNYTSNDDVSTIRMTRLGCSIEVRVEGEIDFDGEAIEIARMGRDARMRIEEDDDRRERWLEIVPGAGGAPSYEYRENGRDATFDNATREWYRAVLLQLMRRMGFAAEQRVAAILRRGGVTAVLEEVELLESDHVRSRYITELLERAELNEAQYRAVVGVATRRVESDHYLAEILKTVAAEQPLTARLLDDYIAASRQLESDHYRTEVLRSVISSGRLNAQQTAAVIESAGAMSSDHYRAGLLKDVADRYALEPAFRQAYLRATASMESDHYRTETLKRLLERDDLSATELAEVLRATRMVGSDHYRTELLKLIGSRDLADAAMRQAYFEAAAGLESDHYFGEAIRVLIEDTRLQPALLANVLEVSAREMESEHYLSELLLRVLERHTVTGEVRTAFMHALDTIESEYYRGRVANQLLRAERR